jgi:hypothetical protein
MLSVSVTYQRNVTLFPNLSTLDLDSSRILVDTCEVKLTPRVSKQLY